MEADGITNLSGSRGRRSTERRSFHRGRRRTDAGFTRTPLEPGKIKRVSIIGAGLMGRSIAAVNVEHDIPVTISEVSSEALSKGITQILEELAGHTDLSGPDRTPSRHFSQLVDGSTSDARLADSDLVIEAVVEHLNVKKQIFARLEPYLSDHAIMASNTSSIPITQLAAELKHPERFCGMHFCHPVRHRPLVEVIRGEKTSEQTVATAVGYVKAIGKSPIVVQDGPGFLVNRLLLPYMNEALELILQGASIASVEASATAFGMPMGPISQFDAIGIDVAVRAGAKLRAAFPDRVVTAELPIALYRAGRLGQKSGAGFFAYPNPTSQQTPDPQVDEMIRQHRRGYRDFTRQELTMRLFLPMLVEATRVLEEKLVPSAGDVDLGLIDGIGFPASKGGLLCWADTLGAAKILELLRAFEQLGKRYQATEMLKKMARDATRFYD